MSLYIAGHAGLVGSAVVREAESRGVTWFGATRATLDLRDRGSVFEFVCDNKPETVVIAAARVGGILSNNENPVEFLSENIQIATNLIDACHEADVPRVLFLGSSCIYPRESPQPIKEEYLLTGPLEPTNEAYAIAKIAGLKLIQSYRRQYGRRWISAMPTNLYGPGDNFDSKTSHVLPATIRKFAEAIQLNLSNITMWGSGTPRREFLHVDDLAKACFFLLQEYDDDLCINVGTGVDISIQDLANLTARVAGFDGTITWDDSMPDGMPRKLLDVSRINRLGWSASIDIEQGLAATYHWFKSSVQR